MNRNRTAIVVAVFIVATALGSIYILQSQARLTTRKLVISTTTSLYDTARAPEAGWSDPVNRMTIASGPLSARADLSEKRERQFVRETHG